MASTINATPTSSGLIQSADNSGVLALQTGGTTAVTIDGSQNVGIGTSSPSTKLQLGGAVNQTLRIDSATGNAAFFGGFNTFTIMASNRNPNTGVFVDTGKASGSISIDANTGVSDIRFQTTTSNNTEPTERMRIDSSGRVLINRTTAGAQMCLNYAGNSIEGFQINDSASSSGSAAVRFAFGGTGVGGITLTGSTTSYNTSSDYRLKEDVVPMVGALATVSALKPVTYKWKIDGSNSQGFIAHELQAVVPECVTGEKDAVEKVDDVDADGKVIGTKEVPVYQGIDTSFLVATLTAAIQELNAKVDAQALEIQALKGVA